MFGIMFKAFYGKVFVVIKVGMEMFFMGIVIFTSTFYLNLFDQHSDYMIDTYSDMNVYTIEGLKKDEVLGSIDNQKIKSAIEKKSYTPDAVLNCDIQIGNELITDVLSPFQDISAVSGNELPVDSADSFDSKDISSELIYGKNTVGENEIIISAKFAKIFYRRAKYGTQWMTSNFNDITAEEYIKYIGEKITISNSRKFDVEIGGFVSIDDYTIDEYKIVGICEFDNYPKFSNTSAIISTEDFSFEQPLIETYVFFNTFDIHDEIVYLDETYVGSYGASAVYNSSIILENQNRFVSRIFLDICIIIMVVILFNLYIMIEYEFMKKNRYYALLNILGVSKKKLLINHFLNSMVSVFVFLSLALLVSCVLINVTSSFVFDSFFTYNLFSIENISVIAIVYIFEVLAMFTFFAYNALVFYKEDVIEYIRQNIE